MGCSRLFKTFLLIVVCNIKKVRRPRIYIYYNTSPLPCCSVWRFLALHLCPRSQQDQPVQRHFKLGYEQKDLRYRMATWKRDDQGEISDDWVSAYTQDRGNYLPCGQADLQGLPWVNVCQWLFSVFKVILWRPEHECWQMVISGIVNVSVFSIRTHILVPFRKQYLCL